VNIEPVACLTDNYAYLVWQPDAREALVVDPSASGPVLEALDGHGLRLAGILCTHHHWDHVGGIEDLCRRQPKLPVYCSEYDLPHINGATRGLNHAATFDCIGLDFKGLSVPGHTLGALAYCVQDAVFTGDTLFGAGCGRLFEGTPQLMQTSLMTLAALPGSTKVYFGHEYTRANLAFARAVEPNNSALLARIERAAQGCTTPSTIAEECATNPFLRYNEASIRQALGPEFAQCEGHEVFAELRRRKDGFRA
jgi:hydroxyacylglutathione hydrolase